MSVTRGDFLKSLGKALPGTVFGTGAAVAQKLFSKVAAVSGEPVRGEGKPLPPKPDAIKQAVADAIHHGPADSNRVALTFDDGPTPGVTDRILDELKARGLKATFFMIGQRIAAAPELARRVVTEGHEVANHTYTHPRLTELSDMGVADEIVKTQEVFAETLGLRPNLFRPPYGSLNPHQHLLVSCHGLRVVMWSIDTRDWAQPGEEAILAPVTRDAKDGSIILCHDKYAQTANVLGPMLDILQTRGLAPVTMSALLAAA